MLGNFRVNLQLFGENGSDSGVGDATGETANGNDIPSNIPERARKNYQEAVAKNDSVSVQVKKSESKPEPKAEDVKPKMSYEELIKSDDYKEQHKAYMEKTMGERFKRFNGLEENYAKAQNALCVIAERYGIDTASETFLDDLQKKIETDDSIYEKYAQEHDMPMDAARQIVNLQSQIKNVERMNEERAKKEAMQRQVQLLHRNAEQTKEKFPNFDLEKEMQDEKFRHLCAMNNGDTTAAYMVCHWDSILTEQVQQAVKQTQEQTAQTVMANKNRPVESGLSSTPSVVTAETFENMSLEQLREYANQQRRKQRN